MYIYFEYARARRCVYVLVVVECCSVKPNTMYISLTGGTRSHLPTNEWRCVGICVSISFLYCMSINYNAMYFVVVVTFAIAICCSKAFALEFFPRLLLTQCLFLLLFFYSNSTKSTNRCVYVNLSNLAAWISVIVVVYIFIFQLVVPSWSFSLCPSRFLYNLHSFLHIYGTLGIVI